MILTIHGTGRLSSTNPAAPAGNVNVTWQGPDGYGNVSAYVPEGGAPGGSIADEFGVTLDGGGSAITTGSKGFLQLNYAGAITAWTILADQAGSIEFDLKKATYSGFPTTASVVASAPPALSSAQKATDSTLSGWTKTFSAGDVFEFSVTSAATVQRVTLIISTTRS